MRTIHDMSTIAMLEQMNLFTVPSTQVSVSSSIETEYRPISVLDTSSAIEFVVNPAPDHYVLFSETYFRLKMSIELFKPDNSPLEADKYSAMVPANYLLHSMIDKVEVSIGNKIVTHAPHPYMYRAYLEALLGYSENAKNSHLTAAGWYDSEHTRSELFKPTILADNSQETTIVELMGRLHLDLTHHQKALLAGMPLTFRITLNKPEFFLKLKGNYKMKTNLHYAGLLVTSLKGTASLLDAHHSALTRATAKYCFTRTEVRNFIITDGRMDAMIDNVYSGQLPRRMFICFVKNSTFNGDVATDPFKFEHLNINYISCYVNGEQAPSIAYQPDFRKGEYLRLYTNLYRYLDQHSSDSYLNITRKQYANGHTIFPFQLSPDLSSGVGAEGDHLSPIKHGNMRIIIRFAESLKESVTMLLFAEFDSLLEIDADRNVTTDYN